MLSIEFVLILFACLSLHRFYRCVHSRAWPLNQLASFARNWMFVLDYYSGSIAPDRLCKNFIVNLLCCFHIGASTNLSQQYRSTWALVLHMMIDKIDGLCFLSWKPLLPLLHHCLLLLLVDHCCQSLRICEILSGKMNSAAVDLAHREY